ncbi:hypothetical protein RZS08_13740, partial [Arthrospira platensis SPKY1]|nr:hypothetical protein [Arthrospira platensis SPKY1]
SDIAHIDEAQPPMLPNEGQLTIDEHYSHQYFVVYQKRATTKNAEYTRSNYNNDPLIQPFD